ncbi:MAG: type II toxin-antitoxin system Phd/YefM family antitoxin [Verrucomicrobiae bacterium]|nr:type II toxin-antitoxin system Phd/YefM family antitoxin [Verrucomicrobiae bacterium]MDW8344594.1 type II toxin-antitoxin system Phd/YefM family antitoxin [Verrucomicrobiae bacterium]
MTISVTEFKSKCLQLLKELETQQEPIEITRGGKVVARIVPAGSLVQTSLKPWQRLRGTGRLLSKPQEGVLKQADFEAAR